MDGLGDWELLDFYGDTHNTLNPTSRSKNNLQFDDYFSSNSNKFSAPTQLLPVPIHFNPTIGDAPHDPEVTKLPIDSTVAIRAVPELANNNNQAFFVKMKETDQFVEMKMDSPKSAPIGPISPQIDDAGAYRFDSAAEDGGENAISPRTSKADPDLDPAKEAADWGEESGGERVWKWSMTGIGALCSFGAAVATVCIINLGSQERNHHKHKARFQIYASEKRIKQVLHQATRLNEVMAGTAGVQLGRAHISYGGHYDSV